MLTEEPANRHYEKGFASAFATVMKRSLNGRNNQSNPILLENNEISKKLKVDNTLKVQTQLKNLQKKKKDKMICQNDVELNSLQEKEMRKTATQGIMRLFNSIRVAKEKVN